MNENITFLENIQDVLKKIVQPYQKTLNQKQKKADFIKLCVRCADRDDFLKLDELLKSKIAQDIKEDETLKKCASHFESLGKYASQKVEQYRINLIEDLTQICRESKLEIQIDFPKFTVLKGINGEMETVMAQSASIRNAAYENIRLLIDNSESSQYLHIFFSIIPDVLMSEKGFKSYDALWSRIRSIGESEKLNYRGVLVDIHKTPLQTAQLIELGRCLRNIHGISYRWEPMDKVTDELIKQICENQKRMGIISEVRLFIKQVITILDMVEQGHSPEDMDMGKQIVETRQTIETEKLENLQPSWDN